MEYMQHAYVTKFSDSQRSFIRVTFEINCNFIKKKKIDRAMRVSWFSDIVYWIYASYKLHLMIYAYYFEWKYCHSKNYISFIYLNLNYFCNNSSLQYLYNYLKNFKQFFKLKSNNCVWGILEYWTYWFFNFSFNFSNELIYWEN